ncbi:MAG: hypothetical protein HRT36_07060 [Alphaproteobacteria bacterium]|nr:hypothetical protein [Alphaproteobacteria bacterium]
MIVIISPWRQFALCVFECFKQLFIQMQSHAEFFRSIAWSWFSSKSWVLYLPPYSPDLNPIEHKSAQEKAIRKQTQQNLENSSN